MSRGRREAAAGPTVSGLQGGRGLLRLWVLALLLPQAPTMVHAGSTSAPHAGLMRADVAVASDIAVARALFERNLDAIRRRDREAYLACYLRADTLARNCRRGPKSRRNGATPGSRASSAGRQWRRSEGWRAIGGARTTA